VGLLNTEGYYDGLLGFMDRMVAEGYLSSPQFDVLQVRSEPADLLDRMAELAERSVDHDDFSAT
jgi:predicted Rossmann-fold nucleotide-binding protein